MPAPNINHICGHAHDITTGLRNEAGTIIQLYAQR